MKTISALFLALICISVSNAQNKSIENQRRIRIEKIINSNWTFNYFPEKSTGKGYESNRFDDSKWPVVSIPHTWNNYETTGELYPFTGNSDEFDKSYWWSGWGWYRKHFSISRDYSARQVLIEFKSVQKECKVWLNSKYLGDHKGGTGSFDFDITGYLKPGEDNVLAVAVNNPREDIPLIHPEIAGNSNMYGGISGDVTLVLKNKLYIDMKGSSGSDDGVVITTQKEGVLQIQTRVKNDYPQKKNCVLQTTIFDAANKKVIQLIKSEAVINPGQLFRFDQISKPFKNKLLWSEEGALLNKVYTEVIDAGVVADNYMSPSDPKSTKSEDTSTIFMIGRILGRLTGEAEFDSDENSTSPEQTGIAGDPARIVLTASTNRILSDRGSVVVITADIIDSNGNHVNDVKNTVYWNVTGPALFAGPAVYESVINKHHQMDGAWYKEMPVSNIIRSTGKPGRIRVFASASGLATGSFDIEAEEGTTDNSVINEPVLENEGRNSIARIILKAKRLDEPPQEIKFTSDEFRFNPSDKQGFKKQIKDYILLNNPSTDSTLIEFKTLTDLFASQISNNKGQLIAADYNFNVNHYNNCRLIAGYITSTKLPPLFKDGLRNYYSNSIIRLGSNRNAGDEMNWLNWIPSGGSVVISRPEGKISGIKGAKVTEKKDLSDLITLVYPSFTNFSEDARERALLFISKMNPYIKTQIITDRTYPEKKEVKASILYTAERGEPILIPDFKFISE